MANMLILAPLAPAAIAASTGSGAANPCTPDPKEVWASASGGAAANLDFDFGAAVSIDSLFIGFIGGAATAPTFTWTSGAAAYTGTTHANGVAAFAASARAAPRRRHGFRRIAAPVAHRYHRIAFTPGVAGVTTIGVIAFGLAFEPTHNLEWGGGRQPLDLSERQRLRGGGFGIDHAARKTAIRWRFGDLTDAEIDRLEELVEERGVSRPVIVAEDPAPTTGLNERLHYGVFNALEFFERMDPDLNVWALSMEEWT